MKHFNKILRRASLATVGCGAFTSAFAQTKIELNSALTKANSTLTTNLQAIANLVSVIMVAVAIILLIWNFIQRAKGDAQAADKLMSFVWALLIGFLILTVLRAIAGI